MRKRILTGLLIVVPFLSPVAAQVDEDQLGAWYMYFWSTQLENSRWGFQGDGQFRNWGTSGATWSNCCYAAA